STTRHTLSLPDALPISGGTVSAAVSSSALLMVNTPTSSPAPFRRKNTPSAGALAALGAAISPHSQTLLATGAEASDMRRSTRSRSEEHTSELQSRETHV